MDNLAELLNLFSKVSNKNNEPQQQEIPKEILDQYPYGEFPIRYTKAGQESLRRDSENRFSYKDNPSHEHHTEKKDNNLNISELIPLLQLMSGKKDSKDMFKILSSILFKDNKDLQNILKLLPNNNIKSQELDKPNTFPDTNKVKISSLTRIK